MPRGKASHAGGSERSRRKRVQPKQIGILDLVIAMSTCVHAYDIPRSYASQFQHDMTSVASGFSAVEEALPCFGDSATLAPTSASVHRPRCAGSRRRSSDL